MYNPIPKPSRPNNVAAVHIIGCHTCNGNTQYETIGNNNFDEEY